MGMCGMRTFVHGLDTLIGLMGAAFRMIRQMTWTRTALVAENEALRAQLANRQARGLKPRLRAAHRLLLAALLRLRHLDPSVLVVVKQTDEKTVAKYMKRLGHRRRHDPSQKWSAFLRTHARGIVATDFATACTIRFQRLYVIFFLEIGSRRVVHWNLTASPDERWTANQFKEIFGPDHPYTHVVHDRDGIFSAFVDKIAEFSGVEILKTPPRTPRANAFIERFIGTFWRECLDHLIILNERMLRWTVREFVRYYNSSRPHLSLGPGIPQMPEDLVIPISAHRHRLPDGYKAVPRPCLGGLHHDYRLERTL